MNIIELTKKIGFESKINSLMNVLFSMKEELDPIYKLKKMDNEKTKTRLVFSSKLNLLIPEIEIEIENSLEAESVKEMFGVIRSKILSNYTKSENWKEIRGIINIKKVAFRSTVTYKKSQGPLMKIETEHGSTYVGLGLKSKLDLPKAMRELGMETEGLEHYKFIKAIPAKSEELIELKDEIAYSLLDKIRRISLDKIRHFVKLVFAENPILKISNRRKKFYKTIFKIIVFKGLMTEFEETQKKILKFSTLGTKLCDGVETTNTVMKETISRRLSEDFMFLFVHKDDAKTLIKLAKQNVNGECIEKYKKAIMQITKFISNMFESYKTKIENTLNKYNLNCFIDSIDFLTNSIGLKYNVKGDLKVHYVEFEVLNVKNTLINIIKENGNVEVA